VRASRGAAVSTIKGWPGRPVKTLPPKEFDAFSICCVLTCCWVETSVLALPE
jgi:hypothetical protein